MLVAALAGMWLMTTAWYDWVAVPGPWYRCAELHANPLVWIYVFSLIETLSHIFEPVPPCASGGDRFVDTREFMRRGGRYPVVGVLALPTAYTFTSLTSNLHLFPTFILRLLASAGHEREYVRGIERLAESQWASGQPMIHQVPDHAVRAPGAEHDLSSPHGLGIDRASSPSG